MTVIRCRPWMFAFALACTWIGATNAEESPSVNEQNWLRPSEAAELLVHVFRPDLGQWSRSLLTKPLELTPRPRVSRSRRPLRRMTLWNGDQFDAEWMSSDRGTVTLRLMNGQTLDVPVSAIAACRNPAGEVDVIDESFENLPPGRQLPAGASLKPVDGLQALRLSAQDQDFLIEFPKHLEAGRIEFMFRFEPSLSPNPAAGWKLEWTSESETPSPSLSIRLDSDRRLEVTSSTDKLHGVVQPLRVDEQWHSFIAIQSGKRLRLIVDDASLLSVPAPAGSLSGLRFVASVQATDGPLCIDALQVRAFQPFVALQQLEPDSVDQDSVILTNQDELLGTLRSIDRTGVTLRTFGHDQLLVWSKVSGVRWKPPGVPVAQIKPPQTGMVSRIEFQPWTDRPAHPPEHLTATIVQSTPEILTVLHPVLGQLTLNWSQVRAVQTDFYGQTFMIDSRRFHLGNSIRADLHRQLPDGTNLELAFDLATVPRGESYLAVDVAELEAGGPDAPLGSPFLKELRDGWLTTEIMVNDRKLGALNSMVRFRSQPETPQRVRLAIPAGALRTGRNMLRISQRPLTDHGKEFDDCEISQLRLETEFHGAE